MRLPVLAGCLAVAWSAPALAIEVNATVRGTVARPDGTAVRDATVTLRSPALMGERTSTTDDNGAYAFRGLPPGVYEVTVSDPTLGEWASNAFAVDLAASVTLDVTMKADDFEIVVEHEAPLVDVTRTATGLTIDAATLENLPTFRSYQSAVQLAPGVGPGGNPRVQGGASNANQFYVDGVNFTDVQTGTFGANVNWDAIEAVQVVTGGMDPEYGRSLGGTIHLVTKTGSNDPTARLGMQFSNGSFVWAPEREGDAFDDSTLVLLNGSGGGAIVKDRIWFYGGFELVSNRVAGSYDPEVVTRLEPMQARLYRGGNFFAKITGQLGPDHRLQAQFQADPAQIDNSRGDVWARPQSDTVQRQGGVIASLSHLATPSARLLFDTRVSMQLSTISSVPILWGDCEQRVEWEGQGVDVCTDDFEGRQYDGAEVTRSWQNIAAAGITTGAFQYAYFGRRNRLSFDHSTRFLVDALGSHDIKAGVQVERLVSRSLYPGLESGIDYHAPGEDLADLASYEPALELRFAEPRIQDARSWIGTAYLQDVWSTPVPGLTLRGGARLDVSQIVATSAQTTAFTGAVVSPRIGAVWSPFKNNKTAVRVYYGRFYDVGTLAVGSLVESRGERTAQYPWNPATGDWATEASQTSTNAIYEHGDLHNPRADEVSAGVSQQLGNAFRLDANVVYKRASRMYETDEVNLIWNPAGTEAIGSRNGTLEPVYRLRTPDDLFTEYQSLQVLLHRRMVRNWSMTASYTLSRSRGVDSSGVSTIVFDIPEQRAYDYGLLGGDIAHMGKLTGSWARGDLVRAGDLHLGPVIGLQGAVITGAPYRRVLFNTTLNSWSAYEGPLDGTYRLPTQVALDARLGLTAQVGKTRILAALDCANLLNQRAATSVQTNYDPDASRDDGDVVFGDTLTRMAPRRCRLTVQGDFR